MSARAGHGLRLTLRRHPPPRGWAIWLAVAGAGLVLAGLPLHSVPLATLLGLAGGAAMLPLLWATRPGPVTVIDRHAGRIEERDAFGRLRRSIAFGRIEGVACDRVTLPSRAPGGTRLTVYRTLLITGGAPVPVRGFGTLGSARALQATIEQWLATAPAPTAAL